ncbi:hypothetical protein CCMSSC00406_0004727 [Pleurotus cornucopiae]|uniref:Uncharacterized protein n=1 Tax=Pleurotus cornucopiae TaxID=5321 RepID=A0ACB7J105_PLECO|nr:hypothetical protein CCMSSC00406_0004727 [Pleurotus cornucopiae]
MSTMEPADDLPLLVDMMKRVVHITPDNVPSDSRLPQTGDAAGDHLVPGIPATMGMDGMDNHAMQAEFAQIPLTMLKQYKSEIGIPDTNQPLSDQDKLKLVNLHRAKREQAGVNTAADLSGPQPGQRAGNRNGTSPGEEDGTLPGKNDSQSSPRSVKQAQHSPTLEHPMYQQQQPGGRPNHQPGGLGWLGSTPFMNPQQPPMNIMRPNPMGGPMDGGGMPGPPMGFNGPFGRGMASGPMGNMIMSPGMSPPSMNPQQQQPPMNIMRPNPMGGPMMGGLPQSMMGGGPGPSGMQGPPMGVNGPFGQGMVGGPMGNMIMSPGMSHPQAGGMRNPQMVSTGIPYRHNMQNIHKQPMPGNDVSPAPNADSPFNFGGPCGSGTPQFNQALGRQTPTAMGTAPSTPAPGTGMNNGLLPPSTPNNPMTAPSPSSMLSMNGGGAAITTDLFSTDFINSVANTLEDFDTSIFRPGGEIIFERDFGQWFNGDDAMGGGLS